MWNQVWNRFESEGWESLTGVEQAFYVAWHLESEVNSGGLQSYYFYSGGDHALDAPRALKRIGALRLAAVVEEANSMFPGGSPPADIDERQERMDVLGDDIYSLWDEMDSRVYDCPDKTEELPWAFFLEHEAGFTTA